MAVSLRRLAYIRSRVVVYFLMAVFVPGLLCLYWLVALRDNPGLLAVTNPTKIVTYYVTMVVMNSFLVTYIKEYIMEYDIQNGGLSAHLLRPYSYYLHNMIVVELPYRILKGGYGLLVVILLSVFAPQLYRIPPSPDSLLLGVISGVMGFLICFHIELILGILTFWFYDMRLMYNAYDVFFFLFTGINIPLYMTPKLVEQIANLTPFPSIIYAPTMIITQHVVGVQVLPVLLSQIVWLMITSLLLILLWRRGLRLYSASGI